jgi:antitoxin component of MazEF toxin-antitoxin module
MQCCRSEILLRIRRNDSTVYCDAFSTRPSVASSLRTMSQGIVGKWGKNLAIRFPGEIAKAAGRSDGERVEIETHDGDIVIRRAVPCFTLEELFRGKSPQEWRAAYAGAFHWGPDVGREVVEE